MIPLTSSENDMATALQRAIDARELTLNYQPKLCLRTGSVTGVEALARWNGGALGVVEPSIFVPLAERAGLIDALTQNVIETALQQWLVWRDQGKQLNIAVNISALSLRNVDFPDFLQHLCLAAGVPCEHVTLELTEGATQHVVRLLDNLTRFRLKGMSVALDDFGTGYSSLLQLRQLPFTELKIDQCFVADAAVADESRLIVKSVIDLAHALGLKAVAEGVEDGATLDLLAALGCDEVQGYHVARPMKSGDLVPWLLETCGSWQELGRGTKLFAT